MIADSPGAGSGRSRLAKGDRIGPYVVLEAIGTGGMGEVYRARDSRLERDVAIKRLLTSDVGSEEARARVLREGRAAAALTHPNIAAVFDVLETPDGLVIVMEYVPGESVAMRLSRGPVSVEETLRIGLQIADALAEAHDHGVIHRDLKPANVHLTPGGKAKILDFGIARSVTAPLNKDLADGATETGRIVGTPGYMSPEQMSGDRVDARTDIYCVGLLLFEMLTARRPFHQGNLLESAKAVFNGSVPRADDVDRSIPPHVGVLIARTMALRPEDRPQDARELHGELDQAARLLSNAPTLEDAHRASGRGALTWPTTRRRLREHRAALAIAILLTALAGFGLWRWTREIVSSPVAAEPATLAVLPLTNQSGDARDDALAVGLTEGLATRLSALKTLRVLSLDESRDAARSGGDAAGAARTLGAAFVVEGRIQRNRETLEVDVDLVRSDGQRSPAGHFTGTPAQLFALHREVADGLTAALAQQGLAARTSPPEVPPPTTNREAFADYSQGLLFLERPDVAGNLQHATGLFQSAVDKDSRFARAYAGLGRTYWALYQETGEDHWTGKATAAILDALRIDPELPEVRLSLAVMYQGMGRFKEAQEELQRVIAAQPSNDDAHRVLAGIHIDRGEWPQAIDEVRKAIALRPNYWRNHSEGGYANYRAGRLDEAAKAYQRVTELQPDSARGYQMLGTVQQSAGDLTAALANYEKAIKIRPTAGTYSNIGTVLFWRGNFTGAADAYVQAIALAPHQPDMHANLGDALLKLGRRKEALQSYHRAITEVTALLAVNSKDAQNLALLALYRAKVGERPAAEDAIAKALAASPGDGDVLYNRAVVHALGGRAQEACAALGQALEQGASMQVVRYADELKTLKGCPVYDKIAAH